MDPRLGRDADPAEHRQAEEGTVLALNLQHLELVERRVWKGGREANRLKKEKGAQSVRRVVSVPTNIQKGGGEVHLLTNVLVVVLVGRPSLLVLP